MRSPGPAFGVTPDSAAERATSSENDQGSAEAKVEGPSTAELVGVDVLASSLTHDRYGRESDDH